MCHPNNIQGVRSSSIVDRPLVVHVGQVRAGVVTFQYQLIVLSARARQNMEVRCSDLAVSHSVDEPIIACASRNPVISTTATQNVVASRAYDPIRQLVADAGEPTIISARFSTFSGNVNDTQLGPYRRLLLAFPQSWYLRIQRRRYRRRPRRRAYRRFLRS